jgi:predicted secreted hydrolase
MSASISAVDVLGGTDTAGFARARGPRDFAFPREHGPHPEFRNEWWYITGNLSTPEGRRFGYQFTIFRTALAPGDAGRSSSWATNQSYMGHFALTDAQDEAFHQFERLSRGALGLAGARAEPFRVWIEDWWIEGSTSEATGRRHGIFPVTLAASQDGITVRLTLHEGKPMVLQGEDGWSRKGRDPGNSSYYYSYTRMPTSGTVSVSGAAYDVEGSSWMDREWSTSVLDEDVEGWDWFSLQLSDGRDVMIYLLRREDGSATPFSAGSLVAPDGSTHRLDWKDVSLEVLDVWESPRGGARYPSSWRLRIAGGENEAPRPDELDLEVRPVLRDQEWTRSVRYWEGAVAVQGTSGGSAVSGRGYVELTGYDSGGDGARSRLAER